MTLIKKHTDDFFPSFFDNFFSRDWMDWNTTNFSNTNTTLPAVNVKEDNNEFRIEVAAPGMNKKDFNINLDNNRLIISSEKRNEVEKKNDKYTRREFSYCSFQRSFQLPSDIVDGNKIKANYSDGILVIHLPKKDEAKPRPARIIEIS